MMYSIFEPIKIDDAPIEKQNTITIYWYYWNANVINIMKLPNIKQDWQWTGLWLKLELMCLICTHQLLITRQFYSWSVLHRVMIGRCFTGIFQLHSQMLNLKQKKKHMSDFLIRFLATCFQVSKVILLHDWNEICKAANQHPSYGIIVYINL